MTTALEKLQLKESLPDDEVCRCSEKTPMHLRYSFSEFPFFCTECNVQVFPSSLTITEDLAEQIVAWSSVYSSLFTLWLDSGEYEVFAETALKDPKGQINSLGLQIAARIGDQRPTYYWWFKDETEIIPTDCPLCHQKLRGHSRYPVGFCDACGISL
jgi:Zn-ribbon-containing, possibly nucleic-acid-binding protein (DUF2310)